MRILLALFSILILSSCSIDIIQEITLKPNRVFDVSVKIDMTRSLEDKKNREAILGLVGMFTQKAAGKTSNKELFKLDKKAKPTEFLIKIDTLQKGMMDSLMIQLTRKDTLKEISPEEKERFKQFAQLILNKGFLKFKADLANNILFYELYFNDLPYDSLNTQGIKNALSIFLTSAKDTVRKDIANYMQFKWEGNAVSFGGQGLSDAFNKKDITQLDSITRLTFQQSKLTMRIKTAGSSIGEVSNPLFVKSKTANAIEFTETIYAIVEKKYNLGVAIKID